MDEKEHSADDQSLDRRINPPLRLIRGAEAESHPTLFLQPHQLFGVVTPHRNGVFTSLKILHKADYIHPISK